MAQAYLVLDVLPDNPGHLIAIHLHHWVLHLDLVEARHSALFDSCHERSGNGRWSVSRRNWRCEYASGKGTDTTIHCSKENAEVRDQDCASVSYSRVLLQQKLFFAPAADLPASHRGIKLLDAVRIKSSSTTARAARK